MKQRTWCEGRFMSATSRLYIHLNISISIMPNIIQLAYNLSDSQTLVFHGFPSRMNTGELFWLSRVPSICSHLLHSFWLGCSSRINQWSRPCTRRSLLVGKHCAEWSIRVIKRRINIMWSIQWISKSTILVWRRKLLALALCICMCNKTQSLLTPNSNR